MHDILAVGYLKSIIQIKDSNRCDTERTFIYPFEDENVYLEWRENYQGRMAIIDPKYKDKSNLNQGYYNY